MFEQQKIKFYLSFTAMMFFFMLLNTTFVNPSFLLHPFNSLIIMIVAFVFHAEDKSIVSTFGSKLNNCDFIMIAALGSLVLVFYYGFGAFVGISNLSVKYNSSDLLVLVGSGVAVYLSTICFSLEDATTQIAIYFSSLAFVCWFLSAIVSCIL